MLELLTILIDKTIDVLLHDSEVKRDRAAPLRLYELYISLTRIIDNAYEIRKELKDSKEETRHVPHISYKIKSQSEELRKFSQILFGISFYVDIYDRETADKLDEILGTKYLTLAFFIDYFLKTDEGWLTMRRVHSGKRDLEKILQDLPMRRYFRTGRRQDPFDEEDSVFDLVELNLKDHASLDYLISAVDEDILKLEATADKLAGFIKDNCDLSDFFPHTSGRRR